MDKAVIKKHFSQIAENFDRYKRRNPYYHNGIKKFVSSVVPKGAKVLEIGCATGDLLGYLNPREGIGIDFSPKMIEEAKRKYPQPNLKFYNMEAEDIALEEKFDYVIMSNLVDYLEDIWSVVQNVKKVLAVDGKLVITTVNPVWEPIFRLGQKLNLKTPDAARNFITNMDLINIFELHDFEILKEGLAMVIPKYIPVVSRVLNFIIPQLPILRQLCVTQYIVAKPKRPKNSYSCSVIVPCHNEEGNVEGFLKRIPKMGKYTEVIVVDDGSTDSTARKVDPALNKDLDISLLSYKPNRGKGHAVKAGFDKAKGDILMILDADMAVMPEELPRFFGILEKGLADFANGTRLIYPMDKKAMPIVNYVGNKFFNLIVSWLAEQRVSDTLCGTKVLFKKDYRNIEMKDVSWGDFDLLFGAAKLCLKIHEMPVHYKERTSGKSKMKAFKHGWTLLRVCFRGLRELKFRRVN